MIIGTTVKKVTYFFFGKFYFHKTLYKHYTMKKKLFIGLVLIAAGATASQCTTNHETGRH